jgi:hypothetical protein
MRALTYFMAITAVTILSGPAHAACTSVAARGDTDIDGNLFTNRFRNGATINNVGDVLFAARPIRTKDRLYLYPAGGESSVVAEGSTAAPGGGIFTSDQPFRDLAINNVGALAFIGALMSEGSGVFVRPSAGALQAAALLGQAAPGGGTFSAFKQLSGVTSVGRIGFLADTDGAPGGVYTHDIGSMTNVLAVANGTAVNNPAGRFLCEITAMDLADTHDVVMLANTKLNCADDGEAPVEGVYNKNGATISQIAIMGGASPVAGMMYYDFINTPLGDGIGGVTFEAVIFGYGAPYGAGLFRGSPVMTQLLIGDFEPLIGGSYKQSSSYRAGFRAFRVDNVGDFSVNAFFEGTPNNMAIISHQGVPSAVVTRADTPPFGSKYLRFANAYGMSDDGTDFAVLARIHDTVRPKSKTAILRCTD